MPGIPDHGRTFVGGQPRMADLTGRWKVNLYDLHWRLYFHDRPGAGIATPRRLPIEAGTLYLIPPQSPFTTYQTGTQVQLFAHFQLAPHLPRIRPGLHRCDRNPTLTALASEVHEAMRTHASRPWLETDMIHLITGCLRQLDDRLIIPAPPGDPRVIAAISTVTARLDRPLDIAALARDQGLGRTAFIRIFRAETGSSPLQYLLGLKMDLARRRLEDGERDLAALSRDLGFVDRSHFTRTFRKQVGVTPAAYRARH